MLFEFTGEIHRKKNGRRCSPLRDLGENPAGCFPPPILEPANLPQLPILLFEFRGARSCFDLAHWKASPEFTDPSEFTQSRNQVFLVAQFSDGFSGGFRGSSDSILEFLLGVNRPSRSLSGTPNFPDVPDFLSDVISSEQRVSKVFNSIWDSKDRVYAARLQRTSSIGGPRRSRPC
jgi:hypothetical protein